MVKNDIQSVAHFTALRDLFSRCMYCTHPIPRNSCAGHQNLDGDVSRIHLLGVTEAGLSWVPNTPMV